MFCGEGFDVYHHGVDDSDLFEELDLLLGLEFLYAFGEFDQLGEGVG